MRKKLIFADFGMELYEHEGRYWMRYDAGELMVDFVEIEISAEEVERSKLSERDAYEVIVAHHHERQKVQP